MLRIAIVDDTDEDADRLEGLVRRCLSPTSPKGDGTPFAIVLYHSGDDLLAAHAADLDQTFDLLFLDIEMPGDNGMRLAGRLRMAGSQVAIVFTTRVARLAALGYDVEALGYLIKPVQEAQLSLALRRALDQVARTRASRTVRLTVETDGHTRYVSSDDIRYVEVRGHHLTYHLVEGSLEAWGSLNDVAARLAGTPFVQVNRYALVNLGHIGSFGGDTVALDDGEQVQVSRARRAGLAEALADYYGSR